MKIAVTASGKSIDAAIEPRFARCPYYVIFDCESTNYAVVENPNADLGNAAGVRSAKLMEEHGVQYVFTGRCGPKATQSLNAARIQIVDGCSGMVSDAIKKFRANRRAYVGRK